MRKTIVSLLMILLLCSCLSHYDVQNFSILKLRNYTDFSKYDRIRFNGYYCATDTCMRSLKSKFGYSAIVLYKDGSMINLYFKSENNIGKPIHDLRDIYTIHPGIVYSIEGDTIKCEAYYNNGLFKLNTENLNYLILNKDSLMSVYPGRPELSLIYKFVKSPLLPDAINVKLKGNEWIWEDKQEYEIYKRKKKEYDDSLKTFEE